MDLKTYLKTYSTISNKFIDDFFGLYKYTTTSTDFVIDLDMISKWLNSNKATLKRTLIKTYTEKIDYIVSDQSSSGGRPPESILLTPDCFKRLCMLSRTAKAEEVRSYFIAVEQNLDKYKNYIIDGLTKKISKYESNLKPTPTPTSAGAIYVLKTTDTLEGVYKIGRTKHFKERLKVHQSSHPDKLEIMYVYETDNIEGVETCLKALLKDKAYRKRKEFYEIDIDVLKQLIRSCDCMHLLIRNKPKLLATESCHYILHVSRSTDKAPTKSK
jgi:phage anti-repressor protein